MTYKIAINGYGRIGRNILRAFYENNNDQSMQIVAINDLGNIETNAHLTRYDSVHGSFRKQVKADGGDLVIDNDHIKVDSERNPEDLPWEELGIDLVLECSGFFASKDKAALHLKAVAKKVLISAPAGSDVKTIVYGVNDKTLTAQDVIVSNAS